MSICGIVNITQRAWALSILAALHRAVPGRQAPLLAATGAGRAAFVQSMAHLVELDLVERNPGHGHPLRPEFRLTEAGTRAAALAHSVFEAVAESETPLLRRTWTLPVLSLLQGPCQFRDIRWGLPRITDRALSQTLKGLEAQDWVLRSIEGTRPPRPLYMPIGAGAAIAKAASAYLRAA